MALTGSVSDAPNNVAAAEYFIDSVGANGTGIAMTSGTFGSASATINATISVAALGPLASGNHTIYVHGRDSLNNWGSTSFVTAEPLQGRAVDDRRHPHPQQDQRLGERRAQRER